MSSRRINRHFTWTGRALMAALCLCLLSGISACGYRFVGSQENRLPAGQSLWVGYIVNDTVSPTAQTILKRALLEQAHTMRGVIAASSRAESDLQVKGTLRSYTTKALSYTAADRIREYRLIIDVELELLRTVDSSPIWKGNVQAYQDFPSSDDLALQRNAEEAALAAASNTLASRFITIIEQSY